MTHGEGPGLVPPGAGPPADEAGQPFPSSAGGPSWPTPPPSSVGSPRIETLAVTALVVAVVSLLVPLLAGIVALVLATIAAQRIRQAPAGAVGGRGLVTVALALSTIGLLAWVGLGTLVVVAHQREPVSRQGATATAAAGAGEFSEVTAPPATEPPGTEPPATEPASTKPPTPGPKVAAGRIGDRLTVRNEAGSALLAITVTKVKFSTGDKFEQPEHGLYMGAYVEVHAIADEQDGPWADSYALVGGHRYLGDVLAPLREFDPPLDPPTLLQGESTAGWLVFDVPARHGRLVLRDLLDEHTLGIWKY